MYQNQITTPTTPSTDNICTTTTTSTSTSIYISLQELKKLLKRSWKLQRRFPEESRNICIDIIKQ